MEVRHSGAYVMRQEGFLEAVGEIPGSGDVAQWVSPGTSDGFETIWSYFVKELPEAFDLIPDPILDLKIDEDRLHKRADKEGVNKVSVLPASAVLRGGIMEATAFPHWFIRVYLG